RSGIEVSTRSADAMALAAAAAGAAERKVAGSGNGGAGGGGGAVALEPTYIGEMVGTAVAEAEAEADDDERGDGEGSRKTLKEGLLSFRKSGRNSGSVGDGRAERISSSTSVSGLGVGERDPRRSGGSGSTTA
ncbi:unnamed protein product, partial [Scytosiphon promiscuus]